LRHAAVEVELDLDLTRLFVIRDFARIAVEDGAGCARDLLLGLLVGAMKGVFGRSGLRPS
jgi:hypothetical protein